MGVGDGTSSLGRDRSRNKGLFGDNLSCVAEEHQSRGRGLGTRMRPEAKL